MCKVNRSSYYDWLKREEVVRSKSNRLLLTEIRAIFNKSRQTYGAIRITKELWSLGYKVNKKRVARLMHKDGLKSVHKRKYKVCTTDSKHSYPVSENVLQQDFSTTAPNQKWGSDITYIRTDEGWLYLAVVLDFCSRKVVGWSMDSSIDAKLCCDALGKALVKRKPPEDLIHHSDRGSQYASFDYRRILKKHRMTPSMSRKGNCYDNSMVESFFHTLKVECADRQQFASKKEAFIVISNYIEQFYNNWRRHSALDYLNPVEYENMLLLAA